MARSPHDDDALLVSCPFCKAEPGELCISQVGVRVISTHFKRRHNLRDIRQLARVASAARREEHHLGRDSACDDDLAFRLEGLESLVGKLIETLGERAAREGAAQDV